MRLGMTSEARGSRTEITDFSIARILADDPPSADIDVDIDVDIAQKQHESLGRDSSRWRTEAEERKSGLRASDERDTPVITTAARRQSGDGDCEDATQRTELTWLQYTRYRPPKLPRRSLAERRVKRRAGDHPRIPFSSSQLQVLENRYRRSAYLSRNDIVEMSATLRLPQSKVCQLQKARSF